MIQQDKFRKQICGCWLGKNIGGTLGAITEGVAGIGNLKFYSPIPTEPLPNDDVELQVFFAAALDRMETPRIDRNVLAGFWLKHNRYPFDEYAIALRNLQVGIMPPHSGALGNFFTDGLGAAIRSELWACLAPGNPELAAKYAFEDACVDHAGNGLYAEVFLAALQSAAFTEPDPEKLVRMALAFVPAELRLAAAIADTVAWVAQYRDPLIVRKHILERYGNANMTDVVMNIPFVVMSLLLGERDFERSILMAVNCGYDTDCTGATVGATLGILAPDAIPERWRAPVGDVIAFSGFIRDLTMPDTLDALTDMVCSLRQRLGNFVAPVAADADYTRARIDFRKSFISWEDFRIDRFTMKPAGILQTTGWHGKTTLADPFTDGVLALENEFNIAESGSYRIIFNCDAWMRCFVDGKLVFCREAGALMPATHRTAFNQFADLRLDAGEHRLTVQLMRSCEMVTEAEFYFGIADAQTKLWLLDIFS